MQLAAVHWCPDDQWKPMNVLCLCVIRRLNSTEKTNSVDSPLWYTRILYKNIYTYSASNSLGQILDSPLYGHFVIKISDTSMMTLALCSNGAILGTLYLHSYVLSRCSVFIKNILSYILPGYAIFLAIVTFS